MNLICIFLVYQSLTKITKIKWNSSSRIWSKVSTSNTKYLSQLIFSCCFWYPSNNIKTPFFLQTIEVAPEEYLIITDPILYDTDNNLNDNDAEQYYYQPDSQELPEETDDDEDTNAYFDIAKKRNLPELLDVSTRDIERPMELPGLENLPLQRTKFYQRPAFSDIQLDYDVPSDYGRIQKKS